MLQGKMSPTTHRMGNQMGEQEVGRLWAIGEAPAPSTGERPASRNPGYQVTRGASSTPQQQFFPRPL